MGRRLGLVLEVVEEVENPGESEFENILLILTEAFDLSNPDRALILVGNS